jgi:hypothetical protein
MRFDLTYDGSIASMNMQNSTAENGVHAKAKLYVQAGELSDGKLKYSNTGSPSGRLLDYFPHGTLFCCSWVAIDFIAPSSSC